MLWNGNLRKLGINGACRQAWTWRGRQDGFPGFRSLGSSAAGGARKKSSVRCLIGIGNNFPEYQNTRHNIGMRIVNEYIFPKTEKDFVFDKYTNCEIYKDNKHDLWLVKPRGFINESGKPVKALIKQYNIDVKNICIIHDDKERDFGKYSYKLKGSANGHNGIKSIMNHLSTNEFTRLRVGVGKPRNPKSKEDLVKYMLKQFTKRELNEFVDQTVYDAITILKEDFASSKPV